MASRNIEKQGTQADIYRSKFNILWCNSHIKQLRYLLGFSCIVCNPLGMVGM